VKRLDFAVNDTWGIEKMMAASPMVLVRGVPWNAGIRNGVSQSVRREGRG